MVKKPRREVQPSTLVPQFRDANKNTITQLSLEDLDRINTPVQTSVLEPSTSHERCGTIPGKRNPAAI